MRAYQYLRWVAGLIAVAMLAGMSAISGFLYLAGREGSGVALVLSIGMTLVMMFKRYPRPQRANGRTIIVVRRRF